MHREQMDVIDLIIGTLKEHEKELDKLTARLENTMKLVDRFNEHTVSQEKLTTLEKFVKLRKTSYLDGQALGAHITTSRVLEDLEEILQIIRGGVL